MALLDNRDAQQFCPYQSIYLCVFVRRFSVLHSTGQPADAWRSISKNTVRQTAPVRNIISQRIAWLSLIQYSHHNPSPCREHYIADMGAYAIKQRQPKTLPTCLEILSRVKNTKRCMARIICNRTKGRARSNNSAGFKLHGA